jgi:hypothetical protein
MQLLLEVVRKAAMIGHNPLGQADDTEPNES